LSFLKKSEPAADREFDATAGPTSPKAAASVTTRKIVVPVTSRIVVASLHAARLGRVSSDRRGATRRVKPDDHADLVLDARRVTAR
jgi:hypothetical protein